MIRRLWPKFLVAAGVIALIAAILLPSIHRMRETTGRQRCPSNLRQIGTAMLIYSMHNNGMYPPSLAILAKSEGLTPEVFVCPDGDAVEVSSLASFTDSPADCSYLYLGDGLDNKADADVILAVERSEDHGDEGVNILCGDGHVDWMFTRSGKDKRKMTWWTDVQSQMANHVRPIRIPKPVTQPAE
jgi:hypothetical protein